MREQTTSGVLRLLLMLSMFGTAATAVAQGDYVTFSGAPSSITCTTTAVTIGPGLAAIWNLPPGTQVHVVYTVGGVVVNDQTKTLPSYPTGTSALSGPTFAYPSTPYPYTFAVSMTPLLAGAGTSTASLLCASATGTNFSFANAPPTGNTIAPQVGLWWNPAESGSGYAIDLEHGVVVVTIYSYNADGSPQWYLVAGPLINNAVSGPLTKYKGGQCISCGYKVPTPNGDDGMMTIVFTSPTTAMVSLPGGRNFQIVMPSY